MWDIVLIGIYVKQRFSGASRNRAGPLHRRGDHRVEIAPRFLQFRGEGVAERLTQRPDQRDADLLEMLVTHAIGAVAVRELPGSGTPEELLHGAGIDAEAIAAAARAVSPIRR